MQNKKMMVGCFFGQVLGWGILLALGGGSLCAQDPVVTLAGGQIRELELGGRALVPTQQDEPLWQVELYDRQTERAVIVSALSDETFSVAEKPGAEHGLRWVVRAVDGATPVAEFSARAEVADDSVLFHFAIEALNPRYGLAQITYPILPLLPLGKDGEGDALLTPRYHGQIIADIHQRAAARRGRGADRTSAIVRSRYPAKHGALQMHFYHNAAGGLLLMTPDPQRLLKEFVLDRSARWLRAAFVHYPASPEQRLAGRLDLSYPVQVRWVNGDWYDAAQIYRAWALRQPWALDPGPLEQRGDVPEWFKGLPGWVRIPRDPRVPWEEKIHWPSLWVEAVGGPLGLHWYGWDAIGGPDNRDWPAYQPPHPDWSDLVARFHGQNIFVLPYLNARIAALDSPLWPTVEDLMVRGRDGELRAKEKWRSFGDRLEAERARNAGQAVREQTKDGQTFWNIEYDFAVGCLSAARWRASIKERVLDVVLNHGADGAYLDQIPNWPLICFDPGHGHLPGDPRAWAVGQEQLFRELRAAFRQAGRKVVLFSEYLSEDLIPWLDGGLTVSTGLLHHRTVPLFGAIYHTHFATIGWDDNPGELRDNPSGYLHQRLLPFVFGSQMGWISYRFPELIADHPELVAAYRQALDLRRRFAPMLGYGKMLRPPDIRDGQVSMAPSGHAGRNVEPMAWPAILSGFFRSGQDGEAALAVFANWTGDAQRGTARLDLRELPRPLRATLVDGADLGFATGDWLEVPLDLPPYTVRGLLLTMEQPLP